MKDIEENHEIKQIIPAPNKMIAVFRNNGKILREKVISLALVKINVHEDEETYELEKILPITVNRDLLSTSFDGYPEDPIMEQVNFLGFEFDGEVECWTNTKTKYERKNPEGRN